MKVENIIEQLKVGGIWTFEHVRQGKVLAYEEFPNMVVDEGISYLMGAGLAASAQIATWYVGLYGANRTVLATDVGTTFPTDASEITNYSLATRPVFTPTLVTSPAASVNNTANRAQFSFTGSGTVYGMFLISLSTKGVAAGTLYGAKALSVAKGYTSGDQVNIGYSSSLARV